MNPSCRLENVALTHYDGWMDVTLSYPRVGSPHVDTLEINLSDVRAADGIRISYDFTRDGWSIKQASRFEWDADDPECDPDWQEVAFVQAWAREPKPWNVDFGMAVFTVAPPFMLVNHVVFHCGCDGYVMRSGEFILGVFVDWLPHFCPRHANSEAARLHEHFVR